jgi:hypothetical protein
MTGWRTFVPEHRRPKTTDGEEVRLGVSGRLILSLAVVDRLGNPERVALLERGSDAMFAVRAATPSDYSYALAVSSRHTRDVNAYTLLWSIGRLARQRMVLPHSWDGDVLVVDVSSVPQPRMGARS